MRFSLVVATIGRSLEVQEFLDSVLLQGRRDLEVIIVDQNRDDRLGALVARYGAQLPLIWLRSGVAKACHARNLGLAASRGEIVCFPDDDCTYPAGLLDRVDASFRADAGLDLLTGPAASPSGGLGSGRWRQDSGPITVRNAWTSVIEFNLFLKRDVCLALGGFDDRLGPGSPFGSAEGNDLVVRAIRAGHKAWYDIDQRIVHPDKAKSEVALERAHRYGMGLGLVLRRHAVPAQAWLPFVLRPLGGIGVSVLKREWHMAAYYWMSLRGRVEGFLTGGPVRDAAVRPLLPRAAERRAA